MPIKSNNKPKWLKSRKWRTEKMWTHRSRTVQVYDLFATKLFGNRCQLKQNRFNYVLRRLLDQITQFIMSYDIDYWAAKTDNFSERQRVAIFFCRLLCPSASDCSDF